MSAKHRTKTSQVRIMKFGGSSLATPDRIKNVVQIILKAHQQCPRLVVVVSALGGVTDNLIHLSQIAMQGEEAFKPLYKALERKHCDAVKQLIPVNRQPAVLGHLIQTLHQLYDICKGISLIKEVSPKTTDLVMSFGERLSAYIVSEYLRESIKEVSFLDAREVIRTDATFGHARVDMKTTNKLIQLYFSDKEGTVVVTGFIGSTAEGTTTTLGRSGSDYTASILGSALHASAIEIWTDVDGIMTADPRLVPQAFPIPQMTYAEAMELSHFGAKVIFPATMQPAMQRHIPILVKNTFHPEFAGTLIAQRTKNTTRVVTGISSLSEICLLNVEGSGMVGVAGVSGRLFTALARKQVNVILISQASSEHSICLAIRANEANKAQQIIEEEFMWEIQHRQIDEVSIQHDLCIVAIVGENMKRLPGTASKMFAALGKNGINIVAIAQGSSEKNISAVISARDQTKALRTLHEAFFLSDKKVLHVFVLGPGLVGSKLLNIIETQRDYLAEHHLIDIRVVGIANTKKMYFEPEGLAHVDWQNKLNTSGAPMNLNRFIRKMQEYNLPNSVFVDATASGDPVKLYDEVLMSSISIVTPNKRACSDKLSYYQHLKKLSVKHNVRFLFETNVGAGLPVISTLNDLLLSGDEILKIEAVMSGTLNYLFYHFEEHLSFTDLLIQARTLGYTEPDPREDLNGMDVARKILILARECGASLELHDVKVENLVPPVCRKTRSIDSFFSLLRKHEKIFSERVKQARQKQHKLKYVATYENGHAETALREIDASHPFYSLAGTENCFCFTTRRYQQYPLVVKGPGAGTDVTAAGVFADIIKISNM